MNNSLKLTTAALLVLGSAQASATDFELDISNTITQSVKSYVQQASNELKESVMNSIEFDGDSAFSFQIHRIKKLFFHLSLSKGLRLLENTIGQC